MKDCITNRDPGYLKAHADMEHEFALDRDDAFDEFCRDKFEEECL